MKATLEFDLPDERYQHLCAIHGSDFYIALSEIDQRLRNLLKHGGIETMKADRLAEEIRDSISEVLFLAQE